MPHVMATCLFLQRLALKKLSLYFLMGGFACGLDARDFEGTAYEHSIVVISCWLARFRYNLKVVAGWLIVVVLSLHTTTRPQVCGGAALQQSFAKSSFIMLMTEWITRTVLEFRKFLIFQEISNRTVPERTPKPSETCTSHSSMATIT